MATDALPPLRPWGTGDKVKLGVLGLTGILVWLANIVIPVKGPVLPDEFPNLPQPDLRAFPGCEGFGCDLTHGRGGDVFIINSTANSGAGTLRQCLEVETGPRICVFNITGDGTITLSSGIVMDESNGNGDVAVFGQTGNVQIRGTGNFILLTMGDYSPDEGIDNILLQHLRFRHNAINAIDDPSTDMRQMDNINIWGRSSNIVLDHLSMQWTGDEVMTFWRGVNNVTVSNSIIGEGIVAQSRGVCAGSSVPCQQNTGPLLGGNVYEMYNITFHNNLFVLGWYRFPGLYASTGANRGIHFINNVFYGMTLQFGQINNEYFISTTSIQNVDIINNYFKNAPGLDMPIWSHNNFSTANAAGFDCTETDVSDTGAYCDTGGTGGSCPAGDTFNSFTYYGNSYYRPNGCVEPTSSHLVGNTSRTSTDTEAPGNDDDNNYVSGMNQFQTSGTRIPFMFLKRDSIIAAQPNHKITQVSASQAYTNVVVNENAGARNWAYDTVDQRLIDAPEDQDTYSSTNIPSPWGTGSFPSLSNSGWTDTDSDGVPDYYETSPLGTNPAVFENHANLDHDGDGYMNIEEWAHSLVP